MADAFDKFVDGTKQAFNAVADVATDLFEKGKGYVNVKQLEAKLRENYRELGKMQFHIETGILVDEEERQTVINTISEVIDAIQKAGANANDAGKYEFVACKNCDAMIGKDSHFCSNCGTPLE